MLGVPVWHACQLQAWGVDTLGGHWAGTLAVLLLWPLLQLLSGVLVC